MMIYFWNDGLQQQRSCPKRHSTLFLGGLGSLPPFELGPCRIRTMPIRTLIENFVLKRYEYISIAALPTAAKDELSLAAGYRCLESRTENLAACRSYHTLKLVFSRPSKKVGMEPEVTVGQAQPVAMRAHVIRITPNNHESRTWHQSA